VPAVGQGRAAEAQQRAGGAAASRADERVLAEARARDEATRKQDEAAAAERKAGEERARQEAEAKALADAAAAAKKKADAAAQPKGAFDGEWEVAGVGGERCRAKSWTYRISIQNGQILVPDLPPGKVSSDGRFTYKYAAVGWRNVPPGNFSGKLTGDVGGGQYNYSNYCLGSMKLKRV